MSQKKQLYTSDMSDKEWQIIKPWLPLENEGPGRPIELDMRQVVNAIFFVTDIQDYHGARALLNKVREIVSSLQKLWADGIYKKDGLVDWVRQTFNIVLDIVERDPDQAGFRVLPRRWVIERTFAWLGRYRRLSKDYETCTKSSEGVIYIASIRTMLKRVAAAA